MSQEVIQLLLGPAGTLVLALTILFGGWRRWWVFGWHYAEVASERDEWKVIAMRGAQIAEKVVSIQESNGA